MGRSRSRNPEYARGKPKWLVPLLAFNLLSGCAAFADDERDVVLMYPAYGTPDSFVVEGRVVELERHEAATVSDSRWVNLRRNVRLFGADECEGCPVSLVLPSGRPATGLTDDEGFFRATVTPVEPLETGWQRIDATSGGGEGSGDLLIVPPGERLGMVSDVDDTVLVTNVGDKSLMLANTFLANPLQREAVPGMAALYRKTLGIPVDMGADVDADVGANIAMGREAVPLFYLSASPRELQGSIAAFLKANDFPRGVLVTKRITADRARDPIFDQFAYKTAKLEEILARVPEVRFVLVGDDAEDDPEVYAALRERFPGRVEAIWIRHVNATRLEPLPAGVSRLEDVLARGGLQD